MASFSCLAILLTIAISAGFHFGVTNSQEARCLSAGSPCGPCNGPGPCKKSSRINCCWCCLGNRCGARAECWDKKDGAYDLQPDDLEALCTAVDPNGGPYTKEDDCVYMKWEECAGGSPDPQRPCGYYSQTKCEAGKKNKRPKRDVNFVEEPTNDKPVFLSFPE